MQKYKAEKKENNQWKTLLKNIVDEKSQELAVTLFTKQLRFDEGNLLLKQPVSECGYNAPRISSSLDKKCNIARQIALSIYPVKELQDSDNQKQQQVWSYIRYQRLIANLSKNFMEELEKEDTLNSQFREVRQTQQRKYFCELKKRPLSKQITDPLPMPVEVASAETLQPFFDHLSSNGETHIPQLEFVRGVQYNDGRMDLCKQVVGPDHIGKLMDSLKNNTQISHFLLGNNIIGSLGAKSISEFLSNDHKPQIKTWYLAGNEIDGEGIKLISNSLKHNTVCEALWLKRNPIKIEGAKHIADLLEVNNTIKILDLDNTGILDEGVKYIMLALRKNKSLKHLYLDANGITILGAKYVAEYFDYLNENNLKGLTSLWLGVNRIDDEGATLIADSLKKYHHIKRLVLNSNRLSHEGSKVLCEVLVDKPNLISFDLGIYKSTSDLNELPNNIGDLGANDIADFIRNNKSVKVLSILHCGMTESGIDIVTKALLENDTIVWLYYEQYGVNVKQETRLAIKEKLEKNIMKHYGVNINDFCDNILRYIKSSKKVKNIDSVYRNRM